MYIDGRLRTGSRPSRTSMFSAVYCVMGPTRSASSRELLRGKSIVVQRLGDRRRNGHDLGDRAALEHRVTFAAARYGLVLLEADAQLGTRLFFDGERVALTVE